MTVLWITDFFPKSEKAETTGGVETRCFYVSKYLREQGYDVKIIARETSGSVWHTASFKSLPDRIIFTLKALISGLKTDFDIVEGSNSATFPIAWLLGFIKRKPVVFWYPDVFAGTWYKRFGPVGLIGDLSDWILLRLPVSRYLAISNQTREKLISHGVLPEKIKVVYCGIDVKEMAGVDESRKKYDLVAVSRLLPYKRLEDLVLALDHKWKMALVGQGPELANLEKLVQKLSLEKNVDFLGFIPDRSKVLEIIKSARVFCHPSIVEGFGIVVVEAMALGVPVVAADIPVIREITQNGKGCLLFKPQDPRDLGEKIRKLLRDKKLYQRKVSEARQVAAGYTWKSAAGRTAQVYEDLHAD